MGAAVLGRGVEAVLDQLELALAADERRLQADGLELAAHAGDDPQSAEERERLGLALELVQAGLLIGDRLLGGPLRRLADEHAARLGGGLDAGGGVDEVAGDHALAFGADRHRRLAGQHPGPRLERRVELGDRGHQVQGCTDGPLGVVLGRRRRPPDGHDRVADELLDRAAVAGDQLAGELEVAREQARARPPHPATPTAS